MGRYSDLDYGCKNNENVDKAIRVTCYRALQQFRLTPQCKLNKLIGHSAVEWKGGVWNIRMTEICFRVAHEAFAECAEEETKVMTELYERITTYRTRKDVRTRTQKEVLAATGSELAKQKHMIHRLFMRSYTLLYPQCIYSIYIP